MADSTREKDGLKRVQIGLTGLLGVILLVGLANIVVDRAQRNAGATDPRPAANALDDGNDVAGQPTDPLAEMGATPAADPSSRVPDLQPDPNLRKRMDRDPQGARQ